MSIGSSTWENSKQVKCKDLVRCSSKMEIDIKDNLEMIILGAKAACL